MADKLHCSIKTIYKIIHGDLNKFTHVKKKVHALKESHKQNRKTNSRKLYEKHLAGKKSEFVVTLDEALFYLQDVNGTRTICYTKDKEAVMSFVNEKPEKFGKKFMVVGAMTGRGVLPLVRVPQNVKINSKEYVDRVLKPLLEVGVVGLYGEEASKVYILHDAAPAHTSTFTRAYAEDLKERLGMTIIFNKEIPVKSPDTSPMDFFGFGYLKQKLKGRRARTLDGVWKILNQLWNG